MSSTDAIEYFVNIYGKRHFIRLPYYATDWPVNEDFFKENKHIFYALLYNDSWFENEETYITLDELKTLIKFKQFPKTPSEKRENLFLDLLTYQKEDGQVIQCRSQYFLEIIWRKLYFKSLKEFVYYIKVLHSEGLIEAEYPNTLGGEGIANYQITFKGLSYAIKLSEEGDKSNKCFIAMSFRKETLEIRKAIKTALEQTGFVPIIIDEQTIDSDRTINDEIIASLKRCKFCIADFSYHSNGVYFESGHALGQGKKVIYTCSKEEFSKAHFDLKPLQHIIYDTPVQLERDLINKIEAWIK